MPSCEDFAAKPMKSMLSPERVQKLLQIGLQWKKKGGAESAKEDTK
jgi:hypothetical protein